MHHASCTVQHAPRTNYWSKYIGNAPGTTCSNLCTFLHRIIGNSMGNARKGPSAFLHYVIVIRWIMHHARCIMHLAPCISQPHRVHAPETCIIQHAHCIMHHAACTTHHAPSPCTLHHAPCDMHRHHAPGTMHLAPCSWKYLGQFVLTVIRTILKSMWNLEPRWPNPWRFIVKSLL